MDIKTFSSIPDREVIDSYGHKKWYYYWKCKKHYASVIEEMKKNRPGVLIVMHHRRDGEHARYNDEHYELWDPEHVIPMYTDEHTKVHRTGVPHSKEWNSNISKNTKGKKKSITHKLSENTKLKISKALRGKSRVKYTEERKQALIKRLTGHTVSEESEKKLSESLRLSWAKRKGLKNGSTRVFD